MPQTLLSFENVCQHIGIVVDGILNICSTPSFGIYLYLGDSAVHVIYSNIAHSRRNSICK